MADFTETTGNATPELHITCLKKVSNADTGSAMYHVFVDNGDFYAAPVNDVTNEALRKWHASNHTSTDDVAFINAISNITEPDAYNRCAAVVNARLEKVTDRISTDGIHLYIDNDSPSRLGIDAVLEDHLVKLMAQRVTDPKADYDFKCYAAFTENLYSNVDPAIRGQLVSWMTSQDWLTFTEDGCFIGYRGAMMINGVACSEHQGPAIVNGTNVNGHVPNPDGAVVEMPRSMVQNDPSEGCARGLHVGTYDYARNWAYDVLLTVKVNPRDVVSVPFECNASKVRVCRFEVLSHKLIEKSSDNLREFYDRPLSYGYDPEDDDDWYDEDGYNEDGYNEDGYDRDGYDEDGYDCDGYDRDGYDRDGYDEYGYNEDGYDEDGYDRDGYDEDGVDAHGNTRDDLTPDPVAEVPAGDNAGVYGDLSRMYDDFMAHRGL